MRICMARWLAVASVLALVATPALAQQTGGNQGQQGQQQQDQQQQGLQQQGQQQGQQQSGAQAQGASSDVQGPSANVPQYWVADAAIYTGSALTTATIMAREAQYNVQAAGILGSQGRFLVGAINQALGALEALQQNAIETNPTAVPPIRYAIGQLQAARAQAQRVEQTASQGQLGPTYLTTIQSAEGHLTSAAQALSSIGQAYGVPQVTQLPMMAGISGQQPGGQGQIFGGQGGQFGGQGGQFGGQFGTQGGQFGGDQAFLSQPYSAGYGQQNLGQGQQGFGQGQQGFGQGQQGFRQGQLNWDQGQQFGGAGQQQNFPSDQGLQQ